MIYLAVPYTHPDPRVMDYRAGEADYVAAKLIKLGHEVYSPISSWHHISRKWGLPTDYAYWKQFSRKMILLSSKVLVITLDGWKESTGVQDEITFAKSFNRPIGYVDSWEL